MGTEKRLQLALEVILFESFNISLDFPKLICRVKPDAIYNVQFSIFHQGPPPAAKYIEGMPVQYLL